MQLAQAFTLRPDERLLAVINTLLTRTYKTPLAAAAPVPENFKRELLSEWVLSKGCVMSAQAVPENFNRELLSE